MKTTALTALIAAVPLVLAPSVANAFVCQENLYRTSDTLTTILRDDFVLRVCQTQVQPGTDRRHVEHLRDVVIPGAVSGLAGFDKLYARTKPALDGLVEKCYSPDNYCSPSVVGRTKECVRAELPDTATATLGPETLADACAGLEVAAGMDPQVLRERARAAADAYISYLRNEKN